MQTTNLAVLRIKIAMQSNDNCHLKQKARKNKTTMYIGQCNNTLNYDYHLLRATLEDSYC